MSFIDEVRDACLDILSAGLLRIRHAEDARIANEEAYHLHNIPSLVRSPTLALLDYYLDVERPGFLRTKPAHPEQFEPGWERLELVRRAQPTLTR